MDIQQQSEPSREPEPQGGAVSMSRRRLFRGAAGGAGVLLTVHARTALGGGVCKSPSAMMSGNTSPRPGTGVTCSGGRSPGFWKVPQKFNNWGAAGATPPTFTVYVDACSTGMKNLSLADIKTQGTTLDYIGLTGHSATPGTGIWAVMAFPTSFQGGQLMRHLSAAWLNAGLFASAGAQYPITRQQIVEMWNATKGGGLYCPGSIVGGCTTGWDANAVINYISGMYDINASGVEPDLCKP